MLQPNIYNINKSNYTHFNTQKVPSNYRTSFALPFLFLFLSLLFFPKVKGKNFGAKRPIYTLKKHKKHVYFTKVVFSTFLVPFSVTFIN